MQFGKKMLERYKKLIKELGYSGRDMCTKFGGMTYDSYRSMIGGSRGLPKWVVAFMLGYDMGKSGIKKSDEKDIKAVGDVPRPEVGQDLGGRMTWQERLEFNERNKNK